MVEGTRPGLTLPDAAQAGDRCNKAGHGSSSWQSKTLPKCGPSRPQAWAATHAEVEVAYGRATPDLRSSPPFNSIDADPSRALSPDTLGAEWRRRVVERYGAEPSVTYFASPVSVDNVSGQILAD
jgi:hypothetical protein